MSLINLAVDYDEPYYPWYNYAHDSSVAAGLTTEDQEPPTRWDPHNHYGCTWEAWIDVLNKEVLKGDEGMYMRPPKEEAKEAVLRLYRNGFGIHFVTARGQFGDYGKVIKQLTKRQLLREGTPYDTITFTRDKGAAAKRLNIHYAVDDRPEHYTQFKEAGAVTFLLDERWNKDFKVPKNLRVYSLTEVADRLIEVYGNLTKLTSRQRTALQKQISQVKTGASLLREDDLAVLT